MIGIHVKFFIKPGDENIAKFLDWKAREGALQLKADGFIKRSMSRDRAKPLEFFYQSYWHSADQMHAFSATDIFKQTQTESGVFEAVDHREFSDITEVFEDIKEPVRA